MYCNRRVADTHGMSSAHTTVCYHTTNYSPLDEINKLALANSKVINSCTSIFLKQKLRDSARRLGNSGNEVGQVNYHT